MEKSPLNGEACLKRPRQARNGREALPSLHCTITSWLKDHICRLLQGTLLAQLGNWMPLQPLSLRTLLKTELTDSQCRLQEVYSESYPLLSKGACSQESVGLHSKEVNPIEINEGFLLGMLQNVQERFFFLFLYNSLSTFPGVEKMR